MPSINDVFPSKYLKASDLQGQPVTATMDRVEFETVGNDQKPILYFIGKQKGVVLNKTNANNIAALYGDDTDGWHGQKITLVESMVDFQGKSVPAIRVRGPAQGYTQQRQQPQRQPQRQDPISTGRPAAQHHANDMDDDIPFAPETR